MINPFRPLLRQREQRPVTVDGSYRKLRLRVFALRLAIALLKVLDYLLLAVLFGTYALNVVMLTAKMIDRDPLWLGYALSTGLMLGISLSAHDKRYLKRRSQQ